MPEGYITLEDAAAFENLSYTGMVSRIVRNSSAFKTQTQPREGGGKEQVMVAVSSLSSKARKAYKAAQKVDGGDVLIEQKTSTAPWYVGVDLNWYIENNKQRYYEAIELVKKIQSFIDYTEAERTAYADSAALALGVSQRTLYRYTESLIEAGAWALRFEKEDGKSRDYFKPLSLCRKPKTVGSFPSLTDEQKAVIENIWFDQHFAANIGTIEMLYDKFEELAAKRFWDGYPSIKTVARYIKHIMDAPGAQSAHYLAANGSREWKNSMMLKCKRDTTTLDVMEFVQGDEHTLDLWVSYTHSNGKVVAVRPKLVAWVDTRTRCILGDVFCVDANSQTLKESFVKMVYSSPGGVPNHLHIDNGKDYTGKAMTGQPRKERAFQFDAETQGFYRSIGVTEWSRSLPYEPWGKGQVERFFGTVCNKFSRWFESYVGTLTGSKTYAKRKKDIGGMLERGELLTMEECFEAWTTWKETKYHTREHRGLKDAGEKWVTPIELFKNGPRYQKAAPPREYAAMLLMKADTALVRNQGIIKFGSLYTDYGLCKYIGQTVGIKWDIDDVTKLYIFDSNGRKLCEAVSAELLQFGGRVSQDALEKHLRNQKRQERAARDFLDGVTTPFEQRPGNGRESEAVGKLDLMIGHTSKENVIALPNDKEFRAEMAAYKPKKPRDGEFLGKQADSALSRLRAINE